MSHDPANMAHSPSSSESPAAGYNRFPRHLYDDERFSVQSGLIQESSAFPHYPSVAPDYSSHSMSMAAKSSPQSTSRASTPLVNYTSVPSPKAQSNTPATASGRVAKACVPCSAKKRRCDGGKPECKVCTVLGTPCSYESRGLKRGPPKGFRSGPKESARAKMLRSLETTIRDLSLHIGSEQVGVEIARISKERGVILPGVENSAREAKRQRGLSVSGKRAKRELSAPIGATEGTMGAEESDSNESDDFLGISEQGNVRHFGSSSGIQLLQQKPSFGHRSSDHYNSPGQPRRTASGSSDMRPGASPRNGQPPVPLPSIPSRTHGSSSTSKSFSPQASPAARPSEPRQVGRLMNHKLFQHYWSGFHPFWPVLYKPGFDRVSVDQLPNALDPALLNAIYSIGACVAYPSLDADLEVELEDAPAGEVFAIRAEESLFQRQNPPMPTLAAAQTCFLLALYNQGVGQLSKAWLYSSVANSMAFDLGLHRHLRHYDTDQVERETRCRLIHCIYILSTILSAEMGRPPMLRSKDIDVPLLSETESDEFEMDSSGRTLHSLSCLNTSRRLFGIVETVLSQVHSFRRKAVLRRRGSESIRQLVEEIYEQLLRWRSSLPHHMKMPSSDDTEEERAKAPVPSFAAVHVWYHTTVLLLYRPFIPHDEDTRLSEVLNDKSHQRCTFAAQEQFQLLIALARSSTVDRLSTDLAYVIFTAAVMFVFNARLAQAASAEVSDSFAPKVEDGHSDRHTSPGTIAAVMRLSAEAKQQFLLCKEWLKGLSERWPAASAHKQLLDGFSTVGEGVVVGEPTQGVRGDLLEGDPGTYASSRTSLTPSSDWSVMNRKPVLQAQPQYSPVEQHALRAPSNGDISSKVTDGVSTSQADFSFLGAKNPSNGASPSNQPHHSFGAYLEFAPNLFDMENVYWNETASRMTPFLGPVRESNANAARNSVASSTSMSGTPRFSTSSGTTYSASSVGIPRMASSMQPPQTYGGSPTSSLPSSAPLHISRSDDAQSGLQILAQQAMTTATSPSTHPGATPFPNAATLQPPTQNVARFSPFSLHQEPSAPEWGDVMSMLQLPPAFTQ